ncbi:MAG: response regulator, partial [Acidimicrobiales bacterium]
PTTARSSTVLVVEDELAIREMIVNVLRDGGYEAIEASDGAVALDYVAELGDRLGAAVIDMMMPNVDGAELVDRLNELLPAVKVVLVSGYNEREATKRITSAGLAAFVKKPFRPAELLGTLDRLLGES